MKTLRDKLLNVLREEIEEHGTAYGWFAAAEAHGAYFMRTDGKIVGVGEYQEHQPHAGVKTLDDLSTGELGAMMGRLIHIGKDGRGLEDLEVKECLCLTQAQAEWILGATDTFEKGPMVVTYHNGAPLKVGGWDDDKSQERTLARNISLRFVMPHAQRPSILSLPPDTTVKLMAREDLPGYLNSHVAQIGQGETMLYFTLSEDDLRPVVAPSRKARP